MDSTECEVTFDQAFSCTEFVQNSRVKDFQPQEFDFYYDQSVVDADYHGHLDTLTLPIYTSEHDKAPKYPDSAQAKTSKYI